MITIIQNIKYNGNGEYNGTKTNVEFDTTRGVFKYNDERGVFKRGDDHDDMVVDCYIGQSTKYMLTGNENELNKMYDSGVLLREVCLQLDKELQIMLIKNLLIMCALPIIKKMNTYELFQKYITPLLCINKGNNNAENVVLRYQSGIFNIYIINAESHAYDTRFKRTKKTCVMNENVYTGKNILNNFHIDDALFKNNIDVILTLLLCTNRKIIPRCIMFNVLLPYIIDV